MATTGIISGRLLRMYIDGNVVAYATEFTYRESAPTTDVDHKDLPGGGYAQPSVGVEKKNVELTTSALFSEDGANNTFWDLRAILAAGTTVTAKIDTGVSGDRTLTVSALITEMELNASVSDNASYTCSFVGSGAPAVATNP